MQCAAKPLYKKNLDLNAGQNRHIGIILCEYIEYLLDGTVVGAQPQGGLWKILLQTEEAREYLLTQVSTLRFNGHRIELHGDNPYTSPHIPSEKITIHDLPRKCQ